MRLTAVVFAIFITFYGNTFGDVVVSKDGKSVACKVLQFDGEFVSFEVNGKTNRVPIKSIARIEFVEPIVSANEQVQLRNIPASALAAGGNQPESNIVDFITTSGVAYKRVKVTSRAPDGISIMSPSGIVKIPVSELPQEILDKYKLSLEAAQRYQAQRQAAMQQREQEIRQYHEKRKAEMETQGAVDSRAQEERNILKKNAFSASVNITRVMGNNQYEATVTYPNNMRGWGIRLIGKIGDRSVGSTWSGRMSASLTEVQPSVYSAGVWRPETFHVVDY